MLGPRIKADGFFDLSLCRFAKKLKHILKHTVHVGRFTQSVLMVVACFELICFVSNDKTKDSTICVLFTHAGKVSNSNRLGGICNCCGR